MSVIFSRSEGSVLIGKMSSVSHWGHLVRSSHPCSMEGAGAFSVRDPRPGCLRPWLWWGQCRFSLARSLEPDSVLLLSGKTLKITFQERHWRSHLHLCLWFAWFFCFWFLVIGDSDQECVHNFFFQRNIYLFGCAGLLHVGSLISVGVCKGLPRGSAVENLPAMQEVLETLVWSLGWEDPLEEGMATHSTFVVWSFSRQEYWSGLPFPTCLIIHTFIDRCI